MLLSGGEPFEHPNLFEFANITKSLSFIPIIISNGSFALFSDIYKKAKKLEIPVQVTNDKEFYSKDYSNNPNLQVPWISFSNKVMGNITPCRRTVENKIKTSRVSPTCFNFRSFALHTKLSVDLVYFEAEMGKVCTPTINIDGSIRAGEMDTCHKIGHVKTSTRTDIYKAVKEMKCNRCGLEENLSEQTKKAIGIL